MTDRRLLVVRDTRAFLLAPGETQETDLGVLELPDDVEPGATVETHLGEAFEVRRLRGTDLFDHLERTGAPMMPRDVGLLVGHTGLSAGDRVLDAGTGTGVLAIAAVRLGAARVVAFDADARVLGNARENLARNEAADRVVLRAGPLAEAVPDEDGFDLILANINRSALLDLLPAFRRKLAPGGQVVLSGLLKGDRAPIRRRAAAEGLAFREEKTEGDWWAVRLGAEA